MRSCRSESILLLDGLIFSFFSLSLRSTWKMWHISRAINAIIFFFIIIIWFTIYRYKYKKKIEKCFRAMPLIQNKLNKFIIIMNNKRSPLKPMYILTMQFFSIFYYFFFLKENELNVKRQMKFTRLKVCDQVFQHFLFFFPFVSIKNMRLKTDSSY